MAPRIVLWLALFLSSVAATPASALETFEKSALIVETATGARLKFQVELAVTPNQQAQGLMFRDKLAADAGMLFVYPAPHPAGFWMKNTYVSLDLLFIETDGRIGKIAERAEPLSTAPIEGPTKTKAVLEINGGAAARLGIRPGDRVVHPALGDAR